MSTMTLIGLGVAAFLALLIALMSLYAVDESEYALELRFGEVKNVRTSPGLYAKMPFIDAVQKIDRRTLRADIPPREVPDKDKERLVVDMVVRYKIVDPVKFRQTLKNEATAEDRLQVIMYSAMRDTIANYDRTSVIGAEPKHDEAGNIVNNEEGLPIYQSLVGARDEISADITNRLAQGVESQGYGLHIISADIKRSDFPSQVTNAIIERLISERQRVAARHRADGEEEYLKRTAKVQAEADILLAKARRDAREIKGAGDAEAIAIIEGALSQDPEFYEYLRKLESYETSIRNGATIIMSDTDGGYADILMGASPGEDAGAR